MDYAQYIEEALLKNLYKVKGAQMNILEIIAKKRDLQALQRRR